MKTKSIFLTLVLAMTWFGIPHEQGYAQTNTNVYSLNIVGYVNQTLTRGYHFIANPLRATNNSLSEIITQPLDGTRVYVWDATNQVFLPPAEYRTSQQAWTANFDLPPGIGFVIFVPSPYTNTFVGEVLQGWLTNYVAGGNRFSLLGSKVPIEGRLLGTVMPISLSFPARDGDNVYVFNSANQTYSDAFTYFDGSGWFEPNDVANTNGPLLAVAQSFFVQKPGPGTNWIVYFVVPEGPTRQLAPVRQTQSVARQGTDAVIRHITTRDGQVTLQILNPGGGDYNVLFSADSRSWTTVAVNQKGGIWTERFRGGTRGFYSLVKP